MTTDEYSITMSRCDIPTVRAILRLPGQDSYRIDILPHVEAMRDEPCEEVKSMVDISVYCPDHHDKKALNMCEWEARGFLVAFAQALNNAGILDEEARAALRVVAGEP